MMKKLLELPDLKNDKNVCVSLSGGLDSTTLVHLLVEKYTNKKVKAIAFNYGQRHTIELKMASKTAERLGIDFQIIKLDYMHNMNKSFSTLINDNVNKPKTAEENAGNPQVDTYIAFRNLQFASIIAAFAETQNCQFIFQGLNAVDEYGYWDTTLEFVKRVNAVLSLNRMNQIQFIAPFVELYKQDELILAKKLSKTFGFNILQYTWSCYNGENESGKECGHCNTCSEKLHGYILAGYSDIEILEQFNISSDELKKLRELCND